jgi:DNA-binding response OmpR family regulator
MYGLDLGANDYLPKPFDIYDLLDSIQRTLPQLTDDSQQKAG